MIHIFIIGSATGFIAGALIFTIYFFMEPIAQRIEKKIMIEAPPEVVWRVLTNQDSMKEWMGEPEMKLEVTTKWEVGGRIAIRGFHHVEFENNGTVLTFDPPRVLAYTSLSSLSRLSDQPENYSLIEFQLSSMTDETLLKLALSNFKTEAIFKHIDFYWTTTLHILKELVEQKRADRPY